MNKTEVTPDGWVVTDLETYRLIANNSPPRPYGYLHQLWIDCSSWKPIVVWIVAAGLIALAVALDQWFLTLPGVILLTWWFRMFRKNVLYLRDSLTCVGAVREMTPHPLSSDYSTGTALTTDGREVPVTFPTRLVAEIIDAGGQAEVLFLHDSQSEFSVCFGARKATSSST